MYELKTNTAVRIPVGPLVDPGDGKTAEKGLTVTDLAVEIFQLKTDGTAVVRSAFAPTDSGGSNDMVHVTDDTTGMYDLELTAAQLNWLGNGRIAFYDIDGFLVHWIDIQVVSAAFFDWKYGTTKPEMNLADDAITASKFDESTAFPLKSADTGATAVARTGADSDTLETLSDQLDAIVEDTGTTLDALIKDVPTVAEFEARTLVAANYFDPAADVVAHVTLVDTTTTNTDMVSAAPSAATISDAVWDELIAGHAEVGSTGAALSAAGGSGDPWSTALPGAYGAGTAGYLIGHMDQLGSGAIAWNYTLTDADTGAPIDGAEVWVSTDSAGANVIASGTTDSSGVVTFMLDAGTVYVWRKRSGYNFTNPDQETVS